MGFFRNFLKGASLTTALFIFQACYGTGPDWPGESSVFFKVVSATDGAPIKDVGIYTRIYNSGNQNWNLCGYTDASGMSRVMVLRDAGGVEKVVEGVVSGQTPEFRFADENGMYAIKDTVITDLYKGNIEIKLQKAE